MITITPQPIEYVPGFLTKDEADALLQACARLPFQMRKNPRNPKYEIRHQPITFLEKPSDHASKVAVVFPLAEAPKEILNLAAKLTAYLGNGRRVNYLSVVRYRDGKDHMNWHQHHEDWGHDTPVLIVSTGAQRNFSIREVGKPETARRFVAKHGSLIVLSSAANNTHQHAALDAPEVTSPRYAINCKCVDSIYEAAPPIHPTQIKKENQAMDSTVEVQAPELRAYPKPITLSALSGTSLALPGDLSERSPFYLDKPPLAKAAADAVRAALAAREEQNSAGEGSVLATRSAGKLLKELQKTPRQSAATVAADSEYRKVLKETGLSERTAQYWQKLAEIPEAIVQEYFTAMKQTGAEITAKGLLAAFTRRASVPSLAERFGAPPFSVLDAKQGYWLNRQRAWQGLGISGVAGRGEEHVPALLGTLSRLGQRSGIRTETSVFNCALTETVYRWFAPVGGGRILDPFAGGSTRGIIAAKLGYHYTGVELCPEQVEENRKQAEKIGVTPQWICGDSAKLSGHVREGEEFDLIFTCPPYYDLERYTTKPEDLSNSKTYDAFMLLYEFIFNQAVARLKQDRFLVIVVGEIRDERGFYRNFVGDTISCFMRLGLHYYNDMIFANPIGSLPLRGGAQFSKYRKVQKAHQNVLCFWKGDDAERIPQVLGSLEASVSEPSFEKAA